MDPSDSGAGWGCSWGGGCSRWALLVAVAELRAWGRRAGGVPEPSSRGSGLRDALERARALG